LNLKGVLEDPRREFVEGDVRNYDLFSDLVEDVDAVVNFAAESHVDRSIEGARQLITTKVEGTQTLLDAVKEVGIDRFLQISTDEVYGQILTGKFSETDRLKPRNPYAATKASVDLLVSSFHKTHTMPVLITRTCNNFGPRQHSEKLIPKFIQEAAAGEPLPVYGDGSNVREWIYVKDNCRALDLVIREGKVGEVYNVGSEIEKTNVEMMEAILDTVGGSEELIKFVDDRAGHDQRYALETDKIAALGREAEYSFEEGLRRTVDHCLR